MSDNVVKFPAKDKVNQEQEDLRKAQKELEHINVLRKASLKGVGETVDRMFEQETITVEHMSPAAVEAFRSARRALKDAHSAAVAHDQLLDMIIHDMFGMVQNMEMQAMASFQSSSHLQALLALLKEKGVIDDEGMKAKWEAIVKSGMSDG